MSPFVCIFENVRPNRLLELMSFCCQLLIHCCLVQSTGKRGRHDGQTSQDASARKKVRADPGDGEGSLFEIVKSGKTALNVCLHL